MLQKCDEYLTRAEDIKALLKTGAIPQRAKASAEEATPSMGPGSVLMKNHEKLANQIRACILSDETKVEMKDVVGLDEVKKTFIETVKLTKLFPKTMAGRGVSKGIMLYGVRS